MRWSSCANGLADRARLLLILLLAAGLRFGALARDARFHPDEALFSTFARSAALNGQWLLPGALDKPPLSIYAGALVMTAFAQPDPATNLPLLSARAGEIAARLPGVLAGLLLVAVVYRLARRLYGEPTALIAALLLALSPFAVASSATAFTDGLMLLLMTAALWAMSERRAGLSGLCLALAFASKQQALIYLPLIAALAWALTALTPRQVVRMLVPLTIGAALLIGWDAARAQPGGIFALAAANNAPWRLIRSDEVLPRLQAWLTSGVTLFGFAPVTVALLALSLIVLARRLMKPDRAALVDLILLGYVIAYLLLHWLIAFNTFDRYGLPLLPPLMLLTARGLALAGRWLASPLARGVGIGLLCAALIAPTMSAPGDRLMIGGDPHDERGIDALADSLNRRALGAIIYDHWLGWELDYYLGQWTDKRRVYYPTPATLADDARRQPDPAPRYFVAPASEPVGRWLDALRAAGFAVTLDEQSAHFVVYRLLPPE